MAAPRGRSYTPRSGPLAGQTFNAPANARGETSGYNAYQQAYARHFGSPNYSALKRQRSNPNYVVVRERAQDSGYSRSEAHRLAREIVGNTRIPRRGKQGSRLGDPQAQEMRRVIKDLIDSRLWDTGDEAADDLYYE
jgi:hypothetical protein